MSYDLTLSGSHRSQSPVRRRNPFTGQDVEVDTYTLTEEELREAKRVLAERSAKEIAPRQQVVRLSDDTRLEIFLGADQDGERGSWRIQIRSLTTATVKFLFDLAAAGNFVVETDELTITTSAAAKDRIADREVECIVVASADEMRVLLEEGFEAWQTFAERVTSYADVTLLDTAAFDPTVIALLREAQSGADKRKHALVEPVHLAFVVLQSDACALVARARGIDIAPLRAETDRACNAIPSTSTAASHFSAVALELIEAMRRVAVSESERVDLPIFMGVLASHGHLPTALAHAWSEEERAMTPVAEAPVDTKLDTTRLGPSVVRLLVEAQSYADTCKHVRVEPLHFVLVILQSDTCAAVAEARGLDAGALRAEVERACRAIPATSTEQSFFSRAALEVVGATKRLASRGKDADISTIFRVLAFQGFLPSVLTSPWTADERALAPLSGVKRPSTAPN